MYKRLSDFLENNNILYEYQFGFRRNHSTSHAVMEVMEVWALRALRSFKIRTF